MKIQKRIRLQTREPHRVRIILVGCGGTGSFLALHLARLAWHAWHGHSRRIALTFVDPDHVELKNIGRQNFCPAEIGQPKAETLARRYSLAFGLDIGFSVAPFDGDWRGAGDLSIIVGAVDNNAARRDIHALFTQRQPRGGTMWYLDCGNHEHAGQVLLGNSTKAAPEVSPLGLCSALPLPTVQHPELLVSDPAPAATAESCAELTLRDAQSLMINQMVASHAAAMLARLLISRDLDYYASYFDLTTGSARSLPITKEDAA